MPSTLTALSPANEARGVAVGTSVSFKVTNLTNPLFLTVTFAVNGGAPIPVITSGIDQAGYVSTKTPNGADLDVVINPTVDFPAGSRIAIAATTPVNSYANSHGLQYTLAAYTRLSGLASLSGAGTFTVSFLTYVDDYLAARNWFATMNASIVGLALPGLQINAGSGVRSLSVVIAGATTHTWTSNTNVIPNDTWMRITVVKNGTNPLAVYFDATALTPLSTSGTIPATIATHANMMIRERSTADTQRMDELSIWAGTAFTPTQVAELHNGGAPLDLANGLNGFPSPTNWYRLNNSLADAMGAGPTGVNVTGSGGGTHTFITSGILAGQAATNLDDDAAFATAYVPMTEFTPDPIKLIAKDPGQGQTQVALSSEVRCTVDCLEDVASIQVTIARGEEAAEEAITDGVLQDGFTGGATAGKVIFIGDCQHLRLVPATPYPPAETIAVRVQAAYDFALTQAMRLATNAAFVTYSSLQPSGSKTFDAFAIQYWVKNETAWSQGVHVRIANDGVSTFDELVVMGHTSEGLRVILQSPNGSVLWSAQNLGLTAGAWHKITVYYRNVFGGDNSTNLRIFIGEDEVTAFGTFNGTAPTSLFWRTTTTMQVGGSATTFANGGFGATYAAQVGNQDQPLLIAALAVWETPALEDATHHEFFNFACFEPNPIRRRTARRADHFLRFAGSTAEATGAPESGLPSVNTFGDQAPYTPWVAAESGTIAFVVDAPTSEAHETLDTTFTFNTSAEVTERSPAPSAIDVSRVAPISFRVPGVTTASRLGLTVGGLPAIVAGVVQTGFAGSVTVDGAALVVSLTKGEPFGFLESVAVAMTIDGAAFNNPSASRLNSGQSFTREARGGGVFNRLDQAGNYGYMGDYDSPEAGELPAMANQSIWTLAFWIYFHEESGETLIFDGSLVTMGFDWSEYDAALGYIPGVSVSLESGAFFGLYDLDRFGPAFGNRWIPGVLIVDSTQVVETDKVRLWLDDVDITALPLTNPLSGTVGPTPDPVSINSVGSIDERNLRGHFDSTIRWASTTHRQIHTAFWAGLAFTPEQVAEWGAGLGLLDLNDESHSFPAPDVWWRKTSDLANSGSDAASSALVAYGDSDNRADDASLHYPTISGSAYALSESQAIFGPTRPVALEALSRSWSFTTSEEFIIPHVTIDIDHCELANDRLAQQFKGRPRLNAVVCAYGDRATEIEQALADVQGFRSIETAFQSTLDAIGALLGLMREGLSDDVYRVRLRAQAKVIASVGRPNELLDIITTLDDGFAPEEIELIESFPAAVIIRGAVAAGEQQTGEQFARFLIAAKAAGVKIIFEFYEQDVTLFSWAVSPDDPAPPANSGWAETDGGIGGRWAEAIGSDRWRRVA